MELTDNLHLIAGDWELLNLNKNAFTAYKKNYQKNILKSVLNSIESNYDFILIDTSTDMGLISDNALSASDGVIINSKPSHLELMNPNKEYTFSLSPRTYKMLEKMTRHNGYEDISEFLDIWIKAFNIEKFW